MSKSVINCVINGKNYFLPSGLTLLQACEYVGVVVPRFCYHDRLSIAGNCRMCLVQLDKSVKPVASCALEVSSGMRIFTNTAMVKKAREGVMEFLLANHPLDCPICDQGGECDLQDQALLFGNDRGRFYETKRAVSDKDWGHLIKTVMTRCIHCTRCQRFSTELSGAPEIAMVGRGKRSEITNFLSNLVTSEVSGNVIDLCPVGALTSKPYAFTARPWELVRFDQIDTTDSMGANVILHMFGQKVFRVLPSVNSGINEEWLSDRGRFFYDGVRIQRLVTPTFFQNGQGKPLSTYSSLLSAFFRFNALKPSVFLIGEVSATAAYYLSKLQTYSANSLFKYADDRSFFYFNAPYLDFSKSDVCVLVGANLKRDLPLMLIRLRFEQLRRPLTVLSFGSTELGLASKSLGTNVADFLKFLEGRHPFSRCLKKSTKVSFLVSDSPLSTIVCELISRLNKLGLTADFSILSSAASNARSVKEFTALIPPYVKLDRFLTVSTVSSLDAVRFNAGSKDYSLFSFTSFGGSHNLNCKRHYFFPIAFYLEQDAYYINGQGGIQLGRRVSVTSGVLSFTQVLSVTLSLLNAPVFSAVKDVLSLPRNSVRNKHSIFSLSTYYSLPNLPLFTPYFSSYQSTPVTWISPLLSRSEVMEKSLLSFSFPR